MKKILLFLFIGYCSSCNNDGASPDQATPAPDTVIQSDNKSISDANLYSIHLSDTVTLSLQQWDSTVDLERLLGKPLKQKTRQLERNSDTFSGSFIKDIEYDGLKLQLFSPPQNGKTFWVQEIILISNRYKTTKGITIGDDWEKVKQSYPSIQKFPGENENTYFVGDAGYERSIEMEFQNNKLKKLRMYYTLN